MATAKKQPAPAPAATVDLQEGRCTCGCGETTPTRSRFRPGHDQRLKGKLARAHYTAVPVAVVQPDAQRHDLSAEAAARLLDTDRFSWSAKVAGTFPTPKTATPRRTGTTRSQKQPS